MDAADEHTRSFTTSCLVEEKNPLMHNEAKAVLAVPLVYVKEPTEESQADSDKSPSIWAVIGVGALAVLGLGLAFFICGWVCRGRWTYGNGDSYAV